MSCWPPANSPILRSISCAAGSPVDRAISSMPAVTYPNTVSLLTGQFPGTHEITGNRWFDRRTLTLVDYVSPADYTNVNSQFRPRTIYEVLSDQLTISIQCPTYRGASEVLNNPIMSGLRWGLGLYHEVDRRVADEIERVAAIANRVGRWPMLTTMYFPGVDEYAHRFGPDSAPYRDALRAADRHIGRVLSAMPRAGLRERLVLALVTDHSQVASPPERRFDLLRWLHEERDLTIRVDDIDARSIEQRFAALERFDAVAVRSNRLIALSIRGDEEWRTPASRQRIERLIFGNGANGYTASLVDLPAVDFVCCVEAPGMVRIISGDGEWIVERDSAAIPPRYRLRPADAELNDDSSGDPLGYRADAALAAFVDAGWHASREWLHMTARSRYPDFVPQVVEMFDSARAGDVVIFAAHDWTFALHEPGGHGSACEEDSVVSIFFAAPDLPGGGRIACGRLVDVMPTLLDLLGESERLRSNGPLDGESLGPALRAAVAP